MLCINISYKVPAAKAAEVEEPLIAHGKHMDHVYPSGNPDGVNPAEAYFTKSEEFNDPTDPSKGKTGNIIFTLNEKWHKPEHIQKHIGKAKAAPHFPKFAEAMQYANVSVMGEIFYELKK